MKRFLRARGPSLGLVVVVMFLVTALQTGVSYSVRVGPLRNLESAAFLALAGAAYAVRIGLLVTLAALWLLKRKRALFRTIIVANAYSTLALLVGVLSLVRMLGGLDVARTLLLDAVLLSASNVLVFSIWYWLIDPPGVEEDEPHEQAPWAFLFPQRASELPHYGSWSPRYADYLFVGFTANFAFSPTDALPLTRDAKMLMMTQAAISVVIVLGIAAGAINALVGSG